MPRHPSAAGSGPRPAGGSGGDEPRPDGRGNDRPLGQASCASSGSSKAAPDVALHGPGCQLGQVQPGGTAASAEQHAALRNRPESDVPPNETSGPAPRAEHQPEGGAAQDDLLLESNDGRGDRPGLVTEDVSDDEDDSGLDSRYRRLEEQNAELERERRQMEKKIQGMQRLIEAQRARAPYNVSQQGQLAAALDEERRRSRELGQEIRRLQTGLTRR